MFFAVSVFTSYERLIEFALRLKKLWKHKKAAQLYFVIANYLIQFPVFQGAKKCIFLERALISGLTSNLILSFFLSSAERPLQTVFLIEASVILLLCFFYEI
jgi:hypothetical protein